MSVQINSALPAMNTILDKFDRISLAKVIASTGSRGLMNRYDTKFIFQKEQLSLLLHRLATHYQLVVANGTEIFQYRSLYFDTDDFLFYYQHHNQHLCRYKLRYRKYTDSGRCYFEIKVKSNKKKTLKSRIQQPEIDPRLGKAAKAFIHQTAGKSPLFDVDQVSAKLWTTYRRITLIHSATDERITMDVDLSFKGTDGPTQALDHIVIAECKQPQRSHCSPFMSTARDMRLFPASFSKYCVGTALLNRSVKHNRFKPQLKQIRKINGRRADHVI